MTQDEIIRMAREAGIEEWEIGVEGNRSSTQSRHLAKYKRFAAIVAAHERERVLNIANEMKQQLIDQQMQMYDKGVIDCKQAAIEAIEAAVLAEREACAKTADEAHRDTGWCCAAAIRARGEK